MNYFITGATGLIGRLLVQQLLADQKNSVHVLIREQSAAKFSALQQHCNAEGRLHAVWGDVTQPELVNDENAARELTGKIDHVFHLAAVYDMAMTDAQADEVNNLGTQHVIDFVHALGPQTTLHHVSSVAVAGNRFQGIFKESMFDQGQTVEHPYYRSKFQSEKMVRERCNNPWRVYRPGMVLGHSESGQMDKIDGPYYFFKAIQRARDILPKWLPLLMLEGGYLPLAPVDYVVNAMLALAHKPALDGQAFHLVQSGHPTVGEVMQTLLAAAHGPEVAAQITLDQIPGAKLTQATLQQLPLKVLEKPLSKTLNMPLSALSYIDNKAVFDDTATRAALANTDIRCPRLETYAQHLWNYWETFMDMELDYDSRLPRHVAGKTVLITGASSGIGFTAAKKLGAAGARVLLVARGKEKLLVTQQVIEQLGGTAHIYPTDLNNMEAIDGLVQAVLADHGHVDILINNAGRSIRRSVWESLDRFHDFERTMQLNYFGCIRLIMGLLPSMGERKKGQIINISSIGCLTNVPRFSSYVASKSALDAFSRCLSAEVKPRNIDVTTIYMPLVRTPMIAPTKLYDYVPTLTPNQAGDQIMEAIIERPKSIKSPLGTVAAISYALWPKVNDRILSTGFRLFPSSAAAKNKGEQQKPSTEQRMFAQLFKGTYW